MRKLLLSLAFLTAFLPHLAYAQAIVLPCVPSGNSCIPVSAANPLPTTGGAAASLTVGAGATTVTGGADTGVFFQDGASPAGVLAQNSAFTFTKSTGVLGVTGLTATNGSITLTGNQSMAAWGTAGIRLKGVAATFTDTSTAMGGAVTAGYTDVLGGNTIAATNTSVTYTNYYSLFLNTPAAGTNVTLANAWSLGTAGSVQVGGNLAVIGTVSLGTGPPGNSGSMLELDRALTSASNAHGFVDTTVFTTTAANNAYATFDCLATIQGAFLWNHYNCAQDSGTILTTVTTVNSFVSATNIGAGGAVTTRNGIFVNDVQKSGGGTVTNNTGILIASLSGGGTTNVAIQTAGTTNPVIFAGQVQYTNWNPPASGTGPVLTIPPGGTYYLKALGDYPFTWGAAASALLTLGSRNSNGSIWMNVPSFNGSNDSGFGVSGSYNSGTNITTVSVGSYGVNSGGPFGSILNLVTTTTTSAVNTLVLTPTTVSITPATDATSTSTGAFQNPGGMSVNKRVWMNGITASAGLQTAVLCQSSGGEVIADSVACLASGRDFKENFASLPNSLARDVIARLEPMSWNYKHEMGSVFPSTYYRDRIGFIAEDVFAIDPRLVEIDTMGKPRAIDYNGLVSLLTMRVAELGADNDNLRVELETIKRSIAR